MFVEQLVKLFPGFVQVLQVFHYVPEGDDIETAGLKLCKGFGRSYLQSEMLQGKFPGLRTLFDGRYLPAFFLHEMAEIAGSGADVQQSSVAEAAVPSHQCRFPAQHIPSYPVVDAVGDSLVGIGV